MIELLISQLGPQLITFAFGTVTTIATILLSYGTAYLRKKKIILISDDKENKLINSAVGAIHFVEELAHSIKKEKMDNPLTKTEMLSKAINIVVRDNKNITKEIAEEKILTELSRSTNLGATAGRSLTKIIS